MGKQLIIKNADFSKVSINETMKAQDGWIDVQNKKSKTGTGAFFGTINVNTGDSVELIKSSGSKLTWYAWLASPLYIPSSDGELFIMSSGVRTTINYYTYDELLIAPADCYLAISLFANDGNEE